MPISKSPRKRSNRADVMVSSTSKDLQAHRKAAVDAIWRRGMYSLAMEKDTAENADAVAYSLKLVDDAEVYIGIFAHRYGYIPEDSVLNPNQISVTEMEYRRALERRIPTLIFIIADDYPVKPSDMEKGKGANRLKKFKTELKKNHVVGFFASPEDLSSKIFQGLTKLKEDGVIEYEPEDEPDAPTALPHPPELYIPHPYILTQTFFGRREELKNLDDWAESTDTTLIVEAIGGIGKSALTWEWFNTRSKGHFDAMLWWSFYESDSAMSNFTRHALAYLTEKPIDDFNNTSQNERERMLLKLLSERRCLLVLDGIERILIAYHRMDAPQISDEQVEEPAAKTPANPSELRACADPRHTAFLQKLVSCVGVKILISTRLVPADLENKAGRLLPGVRRYHLNGLHPDDALALMLHLGIEGDAANLKRFMAQFDNHSLLLGVIAGRINDYYPARGNFDTWHTNEGKNLRLVDLDLKQRRTTILQYALDGLKPELRKLLGQAAAFRYSLDYDTLSALNPYLLPKPKKVSEPDTSIIDYVLTELNEATTDEDKARWQKLLEDHQASYDERLSAYQTYQQASNAYTKSADYKNGLDLFHAGLRELEDRGLLQWDRADNRYDLHPVVRATAFENLQGDERTGAFEVIRSHFEGIPPTSEDQVHELADLHRDFEIYYALVGAGLLDRASEFYGARFKDVLDFQLAAYPTIVELMMPLFPNGTDKLPDLSSTAAQSYRLTTLTNALSQLGRNSEAVILGGLDLKLNLERRDASDLCSAVENYAILLRNDNQLAASLSARELAHSLSQVTGDENRLTMAHLRLLRLYGDIGQWAQAEAFYKAFGEKPPRYKTTFWQSDAELHYAETLIQRGLNAAAALDKAWELSAKAGYGSALCRIEGLRGEVALGQNQLDRALEHFQNAVTMVRKQGSDGLAAYLGDAARTLVKQWKSDEARETIGEALAQHYKSQFADLYNSAAEVFLALGDKTRGKDYALRAYQAAWADGPPYSWWWGLERAKATLAALGEPEPPLPPFDPAKVKPIPYEDEIRAFIEELKAKKKKEN